MQFLHLALHKMYPEFQPFHPCTFHYKTSLVLNYQTDDKSYQQNKYDCQNVLSFQYVAFYSKWYQLTPVYYNLNFRKHYFSYSYNYHTNLFFQNCMLMKNLFYEPNALPE